MLLPYGEMQPSWLSLFSFFCSGRNRPTKEDERESIYPCRLSLDCLSWYMLFDRSFIFFLFREMEGNKSFLPFHSVLCSFSIPSALERKRARESWNSLLYCPSELSLPEWRMSPSLMVTYKPVGNLIPSRKLNYILVSLGLRLFGL